MWLSSAAAQQLRQQEPPSMELLEFLGMLEDDDTRWMVPCRSAWNLKQDGERGDVRDRTRETDHEASE